LQVINIHKRIIGTSTVEIAKLLSTLASKNDMMIAADKWPRMKLDKGLQVGSKGGHGPIKYFVKDYNPEKSITFHFDLKGFDGIHRFDIHDLGNDNSELVHIIDMKTSGIMTLKWITAIRWLHDAYIEDAFDKVENHFHSNQKQSKWNFWVKILRKAMK
jgi:hypothetical protein